MEQFLHQVLALIPQVISCLENPVEVKGKTMVIPSDAEVGDSWKNLKKWSANA